MTGRLSARCAIDVRQVNLGALDSTMFDGRHLVTASALLDLVSESWLGSLAHHCHAVRAAGTVCTDLQRKVPLFTGRARRRRDSRELMNRHQRANDKGFGRAAGPDAIAAAERRSRPSAIESSERRAIGICRRTRGDAAGAGPRMGGSRVEIAPARSAMISSWLRRRHDHIDAGRSQIVVCHDDLIATPG